MDPYIPLKPNTTRPFISKNNEVLSLIQYIKTFAQNGNNILLHGETGVGKEHFAKLFLRSCPETPSCSVNLPSLSSSLIESELFGHEKGAFTDASSNRKGLFEQYKALHLDEVCEIPENIQIKILRALRENEIMKVGSNKVSPIKVQVISTTNISLDAPTIRQDFLQRLGTPFRVPPLRDRKEDIEPLFNLFLNRNKKRPLNGYSKHVQEFLYEYSWPQNIAELQDFAIFCINSCTINESNIINANTAQKWQELKKPVQSTRFLNAFNRSLKEQTKQFQKTIILQTLNRTKNPKITAKNLGISLSSVYRIQQSIR